MEVLGVFAALNLCSTDSSLCRKTLKISINSLLEYVAQKQSTAAHGQVKTLASSLTL